MAALYNVPSPFHSFTRKKKKKGRERAPLAPVTGVCHWTRGREKRGEEWGFPLLVSKCTGEEKKKKKRRGGGGGRGIRSVCRYLRQDFGMPETFTPARGGKKRRRGGEEWTEQQKGSFHRYLLVHRGALVVAVAGSGRYPKGKKKEREGGGKGRREGPPRSASCKNFCLSEGGEKEEGGRRATPRHPVLPLLPIFLLLLSSSVMGGRGGGGWAGGGGGTGGGQKKKGSAEEECIPVSLFSSYSLFFTGFACSIFSFTTASVHEEPPQPNCGHVKAYSYGRRSPLLFPLSLSLSPTIVSFLLPPASSPLFRLLSLLPISSSRD